MKEKMSPMFIVVLCVVKSSKLVKKETETLKEEQK